jgi:hypothetical protein
LERHSLAGQYSRSCGLASTVRADAARELTYNKQYSGAAQRRIALQSTDHITMVLCAVNGKTSAKLYDGILASGKHLITGIPVKLSAGVYLIVLKSGRNFCVTPSAAHYTPPEPEPVSFPVKPYRSYKRLLPPAICSPPHPRTIFRILQRSINL